MDKKILITGHTGYIGSTLERCLRSEGYSSLEMIGLDAEWFVGSSSTNIWTIRKDIRDITEEDIKANNIGAIIHLAGISNDPLGNLNPEWTLSINHRATVRLAQIAKQCKVGLFIFASTCAVYGIPQIDKDGWVDENTPINPQTPYAMSKACAENDLNQLANDNFTVVHLRNATAYGMSEDKVFRTDLVLNRMCACAYCHNKIQVARPEVWRPIVHIEDIANINIAMMQIAQSAAGREAINKQSYNVGSTIENYRIRDIAEIVRVLTDCEIEEYTESHSTANYRVRCAKLAQLLYQWRSFISIRPYKWSAMSGAYDMLQRLNQMLFRKEDIDNPYYVRAAKIKELHEKGWLDNDLRWSRDI